MTETELWVGAACLVVGFVLVSKFIDFRTPSTRDEQPADQTSRSKWEESETRSNASPQKEPRVLECIQCSRKIRIYLPLDTNKIICPHCKARLLIIQNFDRIELVLDIQARDTDSLRISSLEECFHALNITAQSTAEDIKRAYRKKLSEYHPDKVATLGDKIRATAEFETKKLNAVYDYLEKKGLV